MSKVVLGVIGILVIFAIFTGFYFVSVMNSETGLRNAMTAKKEDNKSEFDNMYKKISQNAQVTSKHKEALQEIFTGYAEARGKSTGSGGTLAKWIHEAVPNVDLSTFKNLQNIITSSRDRFTMRQKELLDMKREHDNIITKFPSSLICGVLGRSKIDVTIVTSDRTNKAFTTGTDNDTNVFGE